MHYPNGASKDMNFFWICTKTLPNLWGAISQLLDEIFEICKGQNGAEILSFSPSHIISSAHKNKRINSLSHDYLIGVNDSLHIHDVMGLFYSHTYIFFVHFYILLLRLMCLTMWNRDVNVPGLLPQEWWKR